MITLWCGLSNYACKKPQSTTSEPQGTGDSLDGYTQKYKIQLISALPDPICNLIMYSTYQKIYVALRLNVDPCDISGQSTCSVVWNAQGLHICWTIIRVFININR